MNRLSKKLLSFLLVGIMVIGLAACAKTPKQTGTDEKPTGTAETVTPKKEEGDSKGEDSIDDTSKIDTSEHVKIVYMTTGDPKSNGATEAMLEKLNKILTDKVNAELEIYYIGWTDYLSNYNLNGY